MFHVPNIELTKMQAEAIGLPLLKRSTKGTKEDEVEDLEKTLSSAKKEFGVEGIVTGAIRSIYQSTRIQKVCKNLDLWCFNPLWLKDQIELLNEIVQNDFKVIVSGVFAFPLDESYLGKILDSQMIRKLQRLAQLYSLNPAGEGGEIETTVVDAPFFKKRIEILDHRVQFHNNSGMFQIRKARLVNK